MAAQSSICDFGWPAGDFRLPGADGRDWTLSDIRGPKATLVMFICNHCPYVKATIDRVVAVCGELQDLGVGAVAINANDALAYPEDSLENMTRFAESHQFGFPYLQDEDQQVARAYDAACTPDFFGFNADLKLQYRGRLDAGRLDPPPPGSSRDLYDALSMIAATGDGPRQQIASIGCSIKWKAR